MPESLEPHVDRIVDRDLREVVGGEAPPRDLRDRVRNAIETRAKARADGPVMIRDGHVVAPHTPSRPVLAPMGARRVGARAARRSSFPAAGVAVAATLLLVATLAIALVLNTGEQSGPVDENGNPVVIIPNDGSANEDGADANTTANDDRATPHSPDGNRVVHHNDGVTNANRPNNADTNANRIDPRNDAANQPADSGVVERPAVNNATPTNNDTGASENNSSSATNNGATDSNNDNSTDPGAHPLPNPHQNRRLATVVGISRGDTLSHANAAGLEWSIGEAITGAADLETKGIVDLELTGGALLRLDGRLTLTATPPMGADETDHLATLRELRIDLIDDQLYLDNARGRVPVAIARSHNDQEVTLQIADGVALIESKLTGFEVACIDGRVEISGAAGIDTLYAGERASVTTRGVGARKRVDDDIYRERFLADLPPRTILCETFDNQTIDPDSRRRWLDSGLYISTGRFEDNGDGLVHGSRSSNYVLRVELGIEPDLLSAPHTFIRVRYRISSDTPLMIAGFASTLGEHVDSQCESVPANAWTTVELPVTAMTMRNDRNTAYSPAFPIDLLKFYPKNDADGLSFEIDALELLRVPPQ